MKLFRFIEFAGCIFIPFGLCLSVVFCFVKAYDPHTPYTYWEATAPFWWPVLFLCSIGLMRNAIQAEAPR